MHEFSIAESIMKSLLAEIEEIKPRPARVLEVRVTIGEMHQVVMDSLQMAWEALCMDAELFAGSSLNVENKPVILKCRECGAEKTKKGLLFVCTECGGRDVEITGGREFFIEDMRVESNG